MSLLSSFKQYGSVVSPVQGERRVMHYVSWERLHLSYMVRCYRTFHLTALFLTLFNMLHEKNAKLAT